MTRDSLLISVIIPTVDRAALLPSCLSSFASQTLSKNDYEVLVVDDGSRDATADVCRLFSSRLPLKYFRIDHSGIAAAKNVGVRAASGSILLFADDDNVASPSLLQEHVETHRRTPRDQVAVLGHISWDPTLLLTPLMKWLADFGYEETAHEQHLNFEFFWGGLSSCKHSLLRNDAAFDEAFRFLEDIELGYRLAIEVVFNRNASSQMIRPVTYDAFRQRCERQGAALHSLAALHNNTVIRDYCQRNLVDPVTGQPSILESVGRRWSMVRDELGTRVRRVYELEAACDAGVSAPLAVELNTLYSWTFNGFRLKGFVEAAALNLGEREQLI